MKACDLQTNSRQAERHSHSSPSVDEEDQQEGIDGQFEDLSRTHLSALFLKSADCKTSDTYLSRSVYRLVGLVVKASASRVEDPGFESRLRRDFSGVESYQ